MDFPQEIVYMIPEHKVKRFEYEGHFYILFKGYGIVHDPECSCKKERIENFPGPS